MNIFYLDHDPVICATYHCDTHVIKMIVESAQLLCTAINVFAGEQITPYKTTHANHPCAIWLRESFINWMYGYNLMLALGNEYKHRRHKVHSTILIMQTVDLVSLALDYYPKDLIAVAMSPWHKVKNNPVQSYRNYYRDGKIPLLIYTNRERPSWLTISH